MDSNALPTQRDDACCALCDLCVKLVCLELRSDGTDRSALPARIRDTDPLARLRIEANAVDAGEVRRVIAWAHAESHCAERVERASTPRGFRTNLDFDLVGCGMKARQAHGLVERKFLVDSAANGLNHCRKNAACAGGTKHVDRLIALHDDERRLRHDVFTVHGVHERQDAQIVVVRNWHEELKRLVPVAR